EIVTSRTGPRTCVLRFRIVRLGSPIAPHFEWHPGACALTLMDGPRVVTNPGRDQGGHHGTENVFDSCEMVSRRALLRSWLAERRGRRSGFSAVRRRLPGDRRLSPGCQWEPDGHRVRPGTAQHRARR